MNEKKPSKVQGSEDTRSKLRRLPLIATMSIVACVGLLLSLLLSRALQAASVQAPSLAAGASVTIKLSGVAGSKGMVMAALCDKATFLKRCPYMQTVAASPVVNLKFEGVKPGVYAAMLFHDENGNGEFDRSPSGMPLEGYAFSRNAKGNYGPPSFEAAAVEVKAGKAALDIDMVY
ncbi:hypothetical protein RugamoR64_19760 [Duganella rhizosphaerae]|uniref:DUF2141 domain-containing protein n=1 Tax=Duganella rhizosphaerae TaxID=2885763 RepID=UPI0030E7B594